MFAATDSHGYLTMYGFGNGERYLRVPREQFFHSDYRPLMHDLNGFAVDEQTQQAPHLMPPPFLVNADGNPYSAEYQRLVPGRENLTDAQLTPHTILNENGVAEIIGDRVDEDDNESNEEEQQRQRNRFRHMWVKDLIRPLDSVTLATNQSLRLAKLDIEEDYFITEYKKELQANESNKNGARDQDYCSSNLIKRAGRPSNKRRTNENGGSGVIGDIVIKNNPTSRALYDSDNEESRPAAIEYDEDTLDDQYIDVDDDSNTQMSSSAANNLNSYPQITNNSSRSINNRINNASTSNNNNINNNNNNYIDPLDLASETESSEYSDWAEEDGRRTLKPPPRKATTTKRQQRVANRRTRRQLRVMDDDEDNDVNEEEDAAPEDESKITRKSKRKTKRILMSDDDDDEQNMEYDTNEDADEEEENESYEDFSSDDNDIYNDENMDPNKPCTSHSANMKNNNKIPKKRGRKSKSSTTTATKSKYAAKASKLNDLSISSISKSFSSKSTTKTASKSAKLNKSIIKECPTEFRPPEWLTSTKPRKSPYFPQIGDEVVYFRQGHELYVKAVRDNKIYGLDEKSIPWMNNKSSKINVQEFCRVMGIKIEIKPPRLVCLKLAVIDRVTGKQTGVEFQIKYHDMPHVVDFVILKQYYERGIEKKWKEKDKFRCIIDDVWWFGSIESKAPFQLEYPDSQFQCLKVLWENGQIEEFSPWDLEPISGVNGRKTKPPSSTIGESMAVTIDDIKSLLYVPEPGEWPDDRDTECERILRGLEKIMELSLAEFFNYPVDLDSFPTYGLVISYPIDLNTIKERIESRYYRRLNALQWDVRKLAKNALDFNKAHSTIVQKANVLTELILEFINDPHCTNPMPIYKRLCKNKNLTLCEADILMDEDEDIETTNNNKIKPKSSKTNDLYDNENEDDDFAKGKSSKGSIKGKSSKESARSSHKNQSSIANNKSTNKLSSKSTSYSWKDECKELLKILLKHADSEPFRKPVDLTLYPDYLESVDEPIDFGGIKERLFNNEYGEDLNKFDKDCRLLFQNSKSYNTNKRSKIYGMTVRLQALYESRVKDILDKYKRSINYETSKYGRLRKFRYTDNEIFGNELEETTVKVKSTKQKLRNDIETTSTHINNTRSSSRRSTRHSNNFFSYFNENSNQSNNNNNNEEESNVNSFEQDNIEYDLNNDINPTENENNESKIVNNNNNNDELVSAIQPCTSRTSLKSSLKNRLSRADSETNLSYNDVIEPASIVNNTFVESFDDNANDANNSKKTNFSKLSKNKKLNDENIDENHKLEVKRESNEEEQETINKEKAAASKTSKRGRKKRKKSGEDTDEEYNLKNDDEFEEEEHDDSDDTDFDVDDLDDEDYTDRKTSNKHKKSSKRLNSHNTNSNLGNSNNHSDINKKNKSLKKKSINNLLDNKENNNETDYQVISSNYSKSNSVKSINNKKSASINSSATRTSKRLRKKFHYKEVTSSDEEDEDEEAEESQNNAGNNVSFNEFDNTTDDDDDDHGSNENSNQRARLSRNSRKKFRVK
jgi:bromodomain and WD repeat domain-containing protein 1/3